MEGLPQDRELPLVATGLQLMVGLSTVATANKELKAFKCLISQSLFFKILGCGGAPTTEE